MSTSSSTCPISYEYEYFKNVLKYMSTENFRLRSGAHAIQLRHTPILASSVLVLATAYNSGSYQNIAYVSLGTQAAFIKDERDGQPFLGYHWRSPSS